jgi:hypothetical protein
MRFWGVLEVLWLLLPGQLMLEAVWLMLVLQGVMPLLPKVLSMRFKVAVLARVFLVLGERWVVITQ